MVYGSIEAEEVSVSLDCDNGAGNGLLFRNRFPEKDLQGFPGAPDQIGRQFSVIEKIPAQDLRDAEDKMPVRDLLQYLQTEPLPEFHYALLMTGGAKVAALAGKCQQISESILCPRLCPAGYSEDCFS